MRKVTKQKKPRFFPRSFFSFSLFQLQYTFSQYDISNSHRGNGHLLHSDGSETLGFQVHWRAHAQPERVYEIQTEGIKSSDLLKKVERKWFPSRDNHANTNEISSGTFHGLKENHVGLVIVNVTNNPQNHISEYSSHRIQLWLNAVIASVKSKPKCYRSWKYLRTIYITGLW